MTPAAKKFLENLKSEGFQKAAFYAERYVRYNLPLIPSRGCIPPWG
jgi:hypothetical protein